MAIVNKDKYLKDIGALVKKGVMYFEAEDRPQLEMGGRKVFVSSVSFDMDRGDLTYTVTNQKGEILSSAHGVRPLSGLDIQTLASVGKVVRNYAELKSQRERNLVNVESRLQTVARRRSGVSL